MRVLFVIPAYAPFIGGAQTFVAAMARRLMGDRARVTVLTTDARQVSDFWQPSRDPRLAAQEVVDGVRVVRMALSHPFPPPYAFGLLRRMGHWLHASRLPAGLQRPILNRLSRAMPPLKQLRSQIDHHVAQADWIHGVDASWDGLFVAAAQAAARHGRTWLPIPLIHTGSPQSDARFGMGHQMDAYAQARRLLVLSPTEARWLADRGVPPSHIQTLPMGVEPIVPPKSGLISLLPEPIQGWYNADNPLILFLGAGSYDKGAYTLLHSLERLLPHHPNARLLYAGPQQASLARYMQEQPEPLRSVLQAHTALLGVVDEPVKQALLAASTLLALPSRVDAFGIVVLEAWQHGKPVVVAEEGGLPDLVDHEQTGLRVPFGQPIELAAAMDRLLADPAWAQSLGQAGRQTLEARYTWAHTYATLRGVYGDWEIGRLGDSSTPIS